MLSGAPLKIDLSVLDFAAARWQRESSLDFSLRSVWPPVT
jgi:hypothetical protein